MDRYSSIAEAAGQVEAAVLAIGNFDGVHRGHQALLRRALERAQARGGRPGVLTFHPHPARVLSPETAPAMILSRDEKFATLEQYGAEIVIEQPFDRDFASTPPEVFASRLSTELKLGGVVVGHDFCFGFRGKGGPPELRAALGEDAVDVISAVSEGDLICSSTAVRAALAEGDVAQVARILARPYPLTGVVEHGDGRGRGLGFPTANLRHEREVLPANGVYAARAHLPAGGQERAVVNIGVRPTFDGAETRVHVEAHLLDFSGDLYEQRLHLDLIARIRPEQRFEGVDALRAQIGRDVQAARDLL